MISKNEKQSDKLMSEKEYYNNWNDYNFVGKLLLIFGIICLFCLVIIVISFTILAVKAAI